MKQKKNDSPEWRKVKLVLKIAAAGGIVSGASYLFLNGLNLPAVKNGFLLTIFIVVFITYFGCGLFANNQSTHLKTS